MTQQSEITEQRLSIYSDKERYKKMIKLTHTLIEKYLEKKNKWMAKCYTKRALCNLKLTY